MRTKTIDHFLRATWQAVSKMYNEEASKYGRAWQQVSPIGIDTEEGVPSTSLGPRRLGINQFVAYIKTIENQGLIRGNPDDGRGVLIKLTKLGLENVHYQKEIVIQFNQSIEKQLEKRS